MLTRQTIYTAVLALAVIPIAASRASAQEPAVGDRVRLHLNTEVPNTMVGVVESRHPNYLCIGTNERAHARVPWRTIERLEVFTEQKSNAGKGALIGGGIGVGVGLIWAISDSQGDESGLLPAVGAGGIAVATVAAGAVGAGLGALIGLAIKTDRWEEVPEDRWQIQVAPDPKGGVAIGVNLRL